MTSHLHLIIGTKNNSLSNTMRHLKRHSAEMLHKEIKNHLQESRREWMIWMMERAGKKHDNSFQLWQPENHPIELTTKAIPHQKLEYIHYNPVAAGFVKNAEEWLYSSAIDYNGGKGLLDIIYIGAMKFIIHGTDTPTHITLCCISAPVLKYRKTLINNKSRYKSGF